MASKLRAGLFFATLVVAGAGCAMSQPKSAPAPVEEPETASTTPEAETVSLEDAAKTFDDAERELAGLIQAEQAPREEPEARAPGDASPSPLKQGEAAPSPTATRPENRCGVACRALASMRRSAARLCELSGEADSRCQDVQSRTERARERVARTCPRCSATKSG